MGFLSPLFLLAGLSIAIPLFLHLFYRRESKTFMFPAIRYLLRTEREHAQKIRAQQLFLLMLRIALLVAVVLLGARLHFPGPGGAHEPTALALVIDNSMSSSLVSDGQRTLDGLKEVARTSAAGAGPDDVIWVIRAGEPWQPATPGDGTSALRAIDETTASHARGDLTAIVRRARALVGQSTLAAKEVHVFTDLQASGFSGTLPPDPDVATVVYGPPGSGIVNRSVGSVVIGGGLPPLAGRRTEASISIEGPEGGDTVGVRIFVGDQVRAATVAPTGTTVQLPIGPFQIGRVDGYAEVDPDPLTADDRFYFSFSVRTATEVAAAGTMPFFVSEGLSVLADDGRIALGAVPRAQTILSAGGDGLERRDPNQAVVVFPHSDVALLPALNRALLAAGIPLQYDPVEPGPGRIVDNTLPVDLEDVAVNRYYRITPVDDGPPANAHVTLSTGDPWIVSGTSAVGPFILLASPMDPGSSDLPVSAAMMPLLEWAVDHWSVGGADAAGTSAGVEIVPPSLATRLDGPDGGSTQVDGDQPFLATATVGHYSAYAGDTLLARLPVNAPAEERDLRPLTSSELAAVFPGSLRTVDDPDAWERNIFQAGRGPEPWRPLLIVVLALLLVESVVAASERLRKAPSTTAAADPSRA